jgi:hypothetical protein
MSPVPPTDAETAPPVTSQGNAGVASPAVQETKEVPTTQATTKVDAYRNRGIRSKQSPLDIVPLVLRIVTAVFTLIAFAVIASDSVTYFTDGGFGVVDVVHITFSNLFYFSYLLTVNVITFVYALVTIILALLLLSERFVSNTVFIAIFALDLILSYLLMSASTSAATGVRVANSFVYVPDSFLSKAYASIAFSYLAFFALGVATLFSGFRAARRGQAV